jgi:hypothetical protein
VDARRRRWFLFPQVVSTALRVCKSAPNESTNGPPAVEQNVSACSSSCPSSLCADRGWREGRVNRHDLGRSIGICNDVLLSGLVRPSIVGTFSK